MPNAQDIVVEVCPICKDVRCQAIFGNTWLNPLPVDPDIPRQDKLCPQCDIRMPLVKRLELSRGKMQLELFPGRQQAVEQAPSRAQEGLLEAFRNHTPVNFLRKHHAYYGMTREEVEQHISDHQIP